MYILCPKSWFQCFNVFILSKKSGKAKQNNDIYFLVLIEQPTDYKSMHNLSEN